MNVQQGIEAARSIRVPERHESGHKHVTGAAEYIDDIPEPAGLLHAYLGLSERAHAGVQGLDLSEVAAAPGVLGVLTAADLPGPNDLSQTGSGDEPVFATDRVGFLGQPIFAVVAESRDAARRAALLARVDYEERPHVTDVTEAMERGYPFVVEPLKLERGDVARGMAGAKHKLTGRMRIGGQDHFYLEGQIALAIPGEDDDVTVISSTQHPSEVQHMVAPRARDPLSRGHRAGPAHGRGLRRQGEPGQPFRGGRRTRGQALRACGQDPPRPRRRHDHDGQAPRLSRGLRGGL